MFLKTSYLPYFSGSSGTFGKPITAESRTNAQIIETIRIVLSPGITASRSEEIIPLPYWNDPKSAAAEPAMAGSTEFRAAAQQKRITSKRCKYRTAFTFILRQTLRQEKDQRQDYDTDGHNSPEGQPPPTRYHQKPAKKRPGNRRNRHNKHKSRKYLCRTHALIHITHDRRVLWGFTRTGENCGRHER